MVSSTEAIGTTTFKGVTTTETSSTVSSTVTTTTVTSIPNVSTQTAGSSATQQVVTIASPPVLKIRKITQRSIIRYISNIQTKHKNDFSCQIIRKRRVLQLDPGRHDAL
jgi:hypothetical protein